MRPGQPGPRPRAAADGPTTIVNDTRIDVGEGGALTPFPSPIVVSGLTGPIVDVTVTMPDIQALLNELDILLVSPGGDSLLLLSDVRADTQIISLTFSDAAQGPAVGVDLPARLRAR